MPSVGIRLDCSKLEYWCPLWQECVSCSTNKISIGNHATWVVGSYASVYTEYRYLYDVTIDTVEVNTWIEEGISLLDVELSSTLTLTVFCNNQEIYRYTADVTRVTRGIAKFNVGKRVNGRVVIKYELNHRALSGWVKRAWGSPTVYYTVNPPLSIARLYIDSYPSGAKIYVDGKYIGTAPVTYDTSEGNHDVSGELEGYRLKSCGYATKTDSTCRVYAKAGEVTSVMLEFEPIPPPSVWDTLSMFVQAMPVLILMVMISPILNLVSSLIGSIGKR
jgi:hypothetical protein